MDVRRFGPADLLLLILVLVCAAGARFWYLYDQADGATTEGPVRVQGRDAAAQDSLVRNLHRHGQFAGLAPLAAGEEPTAHVAPGYPWLLSLAEGFTDDWQPLVRWVQCGLGALAAGLYFLFARRAFGSPPVAFLAGLFCAFYPFWVVNTAELSDGVLASFLLALALFLGTRAGQEGGPTASLLYGVALAGLSLVRAALLPFAVAALLWFLLRCRTLRRGWFYALLAFLGFINGLVPWGLRNWQAFGDAIPVADSAYLHLWMGNTEGADGGPLDWNSLPTLLARDLNPDKPASAAGRVEELRKRKQNERYHALGPVVADGVINDPAGTVERRIAAGLSFVIGADWFRHNHLLYHGDAEYAGVFAGALLALLVLAFLGWRWTYPWRRAAMPSSLAVIWIPLPYFLSHGDVLSGPRLPLDGVLLCYAAFALVCLLPGHGRVLFLGPPGKAE